MFKADNIHSLHLHTKTIHNWFLHSKLHDIIMFGYKPMT